MEIGYEWKKADKRKPRFREVIKFRRVDAQSEEFLAMWNGEQYYIYNILSNKWETFEHRFLGLDTPNVSASYTGWEYAYVPKNATQYVPFYAIAMSRRPR